MPALWKREGCVGRDEGAVRSATKYGSEAYPATSPTLCRRHVTDMDK